jgi:60 kDa SS-A/Ro ribonucleoprotein
MGLRRSLARRRQAHGIRAKLVVVGMASNGFTIADPDDAGMLDVVGFDTVTPNLIADFATAV